jgi:hypothetical protein
MWITAVDVSAPIADLWAFSQRPALSLTLRKIRGTLANGARRHRGGVGSAYNRIATFREQRTRYFSAMGRD